MRWKHGLASTSIGEERPEIPLAAIAASSASERGVGLRASSADIHASRGAWNGREARSTAPAGWWTDDQQINRASAPPPAVAPGLRVACIDDLHGYAECAHGSALRRGGVARAPAPSPVDRPPFRSAGPDS